jgi:ABC-type glycerol-3-phosphate transport system substrate-binding protein
MESGDTPDFALWPQPGAVVDAAQRGMLTPLADLDIDLDGYNTNFSSYLVGLGTVDGVVYGGANAGEGSGLTKKRSGGDHDVYRTALCTLMLEVYYRYVY